ncbi:UDP-glycosyltransferase 74B1 [Malania oleifera]|uniref:UDP-glycosyltransferase 74B1 n=1 Tax=Malania oleifera TaxID=397392 RepID=UPI0025AEB345|nr:UDP-glycosyltransferase 74B1 [Malania oleifera]
MGEKEPCIGHVIVVPYPSQGHINPILQFAKRLASKGAKATIATTRYTLASIRVPNVRVESISDGFDDGGFGQAGGEHTFLEGFKTHGSRTLSDLILKFRYTESPVTCVVYDSFLPWALDVAKKHGAVGAAFFTNSAAVCSIFCLIHRGLVALPVKREKLPLVLPGMPPLEYPDLPSFVKRPESHPAYLAMKLGQYSNLEGADWVFANTFEDLEGQEAKGTSEYWPAALVGPMVPSAYLDGQIKGDKGYGASLWSPLSEECLEWLEQRPSHSVVYVSFGSMASLMPTQMEEIAWGLRDSGFPFLWVVKESERAKLPKGFANFVKEKGLIVTWCNQLEMLAHRAVGCFVTHCGWNSILEGFSTGVPMVAVPQWADQFTNAKFVAEIWGVGVRAKEEEGVVRREQLVFCLKDVMEGERSKEIRRNVGKWRELAKRAVSDGGSSDKCINIFVEHLKTTHANWKGK